MEAKHGSTEEKEVSTKNWDRKQIPSVRNSKYVGDLFENKFYQADNNNDAKVENAEEKKLY